MCIDKAQRSSYCQNSCLFAVIIIDMNIDKKRQIPSIIKVFSGFFLLAALISPLLAVEEQAVVTASNEQLEALQNYQTQVEALESEFGPYHQSLLEPLEAMESLFDEQADYERVAELQNRRLQLMRTVLGFEHPDLIPLIQSMIANQLRLGQWQAISDNLEHIRHIQASNTDDPELLLATIENQAFWHLSRAYLDEKNLRVRNFFLARGLYDEMEELAEVSYGEDSLEMIPWLYKQAYNKFQLVQFLNASDGVGSDSVDRLAREDGISRLRRTRGRNLIDADALFGLGNSIPIVEGDSLIGEDYLREGYGLVARMERILEAEDDLEAAAMATIYRADFQLLQQQGIGIRNYREAQELLLQAGIAEDRIALFFERPMVIPVDKFFLKLDDAIAYQQQSLDQLDPIPEGQVHLGVFTAWSEALASTQKPVSPGPFWQLDLPYSQVDVSFSVSSRGGTSSIDVIESIPDERSVRRKASRALREINIRPAIVKGRGKRVKDVRVRYRFLED